MFSPRCWVVRGPKSVVEKDDLGRRGLPFLLREFVLDALAPFKGDACLFESTDMHEDIASGCIWNDEAEILVGVVPLYSTGWHRSLLLGKVCYDERRGFMMAEFDETSPEIQRALTDLAKMLEARIVGRDLNQGTLNLCEEIIDHHRAKWKLRGVDFPRMTYIFIPEHGYLKLVRKDWDQKAIETEIVNTTTHCPSATAVQIAQAIKRAFPHYVPRIDPSLPTPFPKKPTLLH